MLGSDLHDGFVLQHGVARRFYFGEHVAHGLFDVDVLAGFDREFQQR